MVATLILRASGTDAGHARCRSTGDLANPINTMWKSSVFFQKWRNGRTQGTFAAHLYKQWRNTTIAMVSTHFFFSQPTRLLCPLLSRWKEADPNNSKFVPAYPRVHPAGDVHSGSAPPQRFSSKDFALYTRGQPRQDASITVADLGKTLNFVVPEVVIQRCLSSYLFRVASEPPRWHDNRQLLGISPMAIWGECLWTKTSMKKLGRNKSWVRPQKTISERSTGGRSFGTNEANPFPSCW